MCTVKCKRGWECNISKRNCERIIYVHIDHPATIIVKVSFMMYPRVMCAKRGRVGQEMQFSSDNKEILIHLLLLFFVFFSCHWKKETKLIKEIKHTKESKTTTTNTLQIIASLAQDMNEHHVRLFYCMRVGKNARRYPLSHQNAIATSDEVIVKNRYRHIRLDVAKCKAINLHSGTGTPKNEKKTSVK